MTQGFNTTVGIVLANMAAYKNIIRQGYKGKLMYDMWQEGQLANDIIMILVGNIFTHPFAFFFDPTWIIAKIKRWHVKKYPFNYTQKEAHKIYEPIQPDMDEWYANIHRTLIISLFYTPVVPFSMFFGCIAIAVQYWADKG